MFGDAVSSESESVLQVYLLGAIDFETALQFQRRLHYEVSGNRRQGALILCEHPPIISVGRQGSRSQIFFEPEDLTTWKWRIRWVNRGGGCMLHLPGQLAIYPILPLDALKISVTQYVQALGEVLIGTLGDFRIPMPKRATPTGIYIGNRMVAGIGVAVRDWVSYFGATLNVNPALGFYRAIRCDRHSLEPMTSLERERRGPVRPSLVRERLLEHFQTRFPFDRISLFQDHPLLHNESTRRNMGMRVPS